MSALKIIRNIVRLLFRAILTIFLLLLFVFVLTAGLLQVPYVQTRLAMEATAWVSKTIKYPILIGRVNFNWVDEINLEDIHIKDLKGNEMIQLERLTANFRLLSLLGRNIVVEEARLTRPVVKLFYDKQVDDLNMGDFIYRITHINYTPAKDEQISSGKRTQFIISKIKLEDGYCSFDDPEKEVWKDRFDPSHFRFDSIFIDVDRFSVIADTIELDVSHLSTLEKRTNLSIKHMATKFGICENYLHLDSLEAHIGNSLVKKQVRLSYNGYGQLSDIEDSVLMEADFSDTRIHSEDLAAFAPDIKGFNETWIFSGIFKGKVNNFMLRRMTVTFGTHSSLEGQVAFKGLPSWDNALMSLDFKQSYLLSKDIKKYLPQSTHSVLSKFKEGKFKGSFFGFHNDFVADGSFDTDLGRFATDVNLKISANQQAIYKGSLQTSNFDLGKLTGYSKELGLIDMNGSLQGKGLRIDNADLLLNAKISRIHVKGYNYRNLQVNAHLSNALFKGSFDIKDTNIVIDALGDVDLSGANDVYHVDAHIKRIRLKELGFSDKEFNIATNIKADFTGEGISRLNGEMVCAGSNVAYQGKSVDIKFLEFSSVHNEKSDVLSLSSDYADARITGKFSLPEVAGDMVALYKDLLKKFSESDSSGLSDQAYKYSKQNYGVLYELSLKDLNPVLNVFLPGWYLSAQTRVSGNIRNLGTQSFSIFSHVDTLKINNIGFYNSQVESYISRFSKSKNILAVTIINSSLQSLNNEPAFENLFIEGVWSGDVLSFESSLNQYQQTNNAYLSGDITFMPNQLELKFKQSKLNLLGKQWVLNDDNLVDFFSHQVALKNVSFSNGKESISLSGKVSVNPDDALLLDINNFNLDVLGEFMQVKTDGILNGYIIFKNLMKDVFVVSELKVDSLMIDHFLIGNVKGFSRWDNNLKKIEMSYNVSRQENKLVQFTGYYDPVNEENQLDLNIAFNQTDVRIVQPFIKDIFSDIEGMATGNVQINGRLNEPKLNGSLQISKGKMRLAYLNATFFFNDRIYIEPDRFYIKGFKITDGEAGHGMLTAAVSHKKFKNFSFTLNADLFKFKVLNTNAKDNNLYYGEAYASGSVDITGNFNTLRIMANASTDKGTRIFIPLSSTENIQKSDFITFKNATKTDAGIAKKDKVDLSGIQMEFNFDITTDAYCEIIFDQRSGDIIKGTGNGKLKLAIDTRGEFNLYGDYRFENGTYNFTFMDVINKGFKIRSGSSIVWNGSPYGGVLDFSASYDLLASLKPLISDQSEETLNVPELSRGYSVSTIINLRGDLLKPVFTYNLLIKDYPQNLQVGGGSLYNYVTAFMARAQSDEQFLGRQVLGLLLFKRFLTDYQSTVNAGQTLAGNLSEMLSNNLNRWLTEEIDQNLQVNLNLNGIDHDALNSSQLKLSYSLLNGKLRITRNSALSSTNNSQTQSSTSSIIGEWTVEYMLSADGKFRLKGFNKNNPNIMATGTGNTYTTVAGVSVQHTSGFNTFSELFSKRKKKKKPNQNEKNKPK